MVIEYKQWEPKKPTGELLSLIGKTVVNKSETCKKSVTKDYLRNLVKSSKEVWCDRIEFKDKFYRVLGCGDRLSITVDMTEDEFNGQCVGKIINVYYG